MATKDMMDAHALGRCKETMMSLVRDFHNDVRWPYSKVPKYTVMQPGGWLTTV